MVEQHAHNDDVHSKDWLIFLMGTYKLFTIKPTILQGGLRLTEMQDLKLKDHV